jgi:hypothetical protein
MVDTPGSAGSAGPYASATETLRSAAKWLLAAVAAVGGALVAGLQLTNLGRLGSDELPRLILALVAVAAAAVAVGYMIREASGVLTSEWVTLTHFDDATFENMVREGRSGLDKEHLQEISAKIDDVREELYGHVASTIGQLHTYLREANDKAAKVASGELPATAYERAEAIARSRELRAVARDVVDYANYERTLRLFDQLKTRLARGAIVVLIAVTLFAYATNPSKAQSPLKVHISGTSP